MCTSYLNYNRYTKNWTKRKPDPVLLTKRLRSCRIISDCFAMVQFSIRFKLSREIVRSLLYIIDFLLGKKRLIRMHVTIAFVQTLLPNKPLYLAINFTSCVTSKNRKNTKIYAKNTKKFYCWC